MTHFADIAWTRWSPDGERTAVPTVRVGKAVGAALLDRLKKHPTTTVRFTGTAKSPLPLRRHADVVPTIPAGRVHGVRAQQRGAADHVRRQRRSALGQ